MKRSTITYLAALIGSICLICCKSIIADALTALFAADAETAVDMLLSFIGKLLACGLYAAGAVLLWIGWTLHKSGVVLAADVVYFVALIVNLDDWGLAAVLLGFGAFAYVEERYLQDTPNVKITTKPLIDVIVLTIFALLISSVIVGIHDNDLLGTRKKTDGIDLTVDPEDLDKYKIDVDHLLPPTR